MEVTNGSLLLLYRYILHNLHYFTILMVHLTVLLVRSVGYDHLTHHHEMLHYFIKKHPFPRQHCRTTFQYKLKLNDKPKLSNWFIYYIGKFHTDILIAFFKSNSTTLYILDMIKMTAPILCSVNIKKNKYFYIRYSVGFEYLLYNRFY